MRDDAAIALAFAELKLRATCDPQARALALDAIHRQRREAEAAGDWPHRDARLNALALLERKLQQSPPSLGP